MLKFHAKSNGFWQGSENIFKAAYRLKRHPRHCDRQAELDQQVPFAFFSLIEHKLILAAVFKLPKGKLTDSNRVFVCKFELSVDKAVTVRTQALQVFQLCDVIGSHVGYC